MACPLLVDIFPCTLAVFKAYNYPGYSSLVFTLELAKLISMELIALTTILFLLTILYRLKRWKENTTTHQARRKSPPEPAGSWPIIGHLHFVVGDDKIPHVVLGDLADKYGSTFMIRLGTNYRALVISSSQMAKECLANDQVFLNRPPTIFVNNMVSAMLAFTSYGPYWREIRKIATLELLSNRGIEMTKHLRILELRSSIRSIHDDFIRVKGKSSDGELVLDMKEWFEELALSTVVKLVAGKSLKECFQGKEHDEYKKALQEFLRLAGLFLPGDGLPFLRWLDIGGHEKAMKKVLRKIDHVVQGWLDEHKRRRGRAEDRGKQDFMDVMLDLFETGQVKHSKFDEDTIIKATCTNMILGAADTTAIMLIWALSLLLNNREALKKVQFELDTLMGNGKKQDIESILKDSVYLHAIIKETMRLYPAGPLSLARVAISDTTINGYHVVAGTWLMVNIHKIHRDPQVWGPDPLEFRPERFLERDYEVRVGKKNDFELIPFGGGKRVCPGISLAQHFLPLVLATLLHQFEFSTLMGKAVDMTEEHGGLTLVKATPLEVVVTPRLLPDNLCDHQ